MFEGDDYIGAAVNTAARLADVADPNELLITGALAHALRGVVVAGPPRAIAMRGLPGFLEVRALRAAGVERGLRACRDGTGLASRGRRPRRFD
jgi:class 3 adenylate cyclase